YNHLHLTTESTDAYRKALNLAEKEMSLNTRDGDTRSVLGLLCAKLGDRRRAESEIAQALQSSPNNAVTLFTGALTYEALNNRQQTLNVLSASPIGVLQDLSRWPDMADLRKDPRFIQMIASKLN
ncbi:MAG: hypothetical protein WKF37_18755, partial [Bryobacteraceae bacterium]